MSIKNPNYDKEYYIKNRTRILERNHLWQKNNQEKVRKKAKEWKDINRDRLLARMRVSSKNWRERNIDKVQIARYKTRDKLRMDVLSAYGGICACCNESTIQFLAIDHINGGGNVHKRSLGLKSAQAFYTWLRINKYPSGFQVLCHNCNMAKGFYGECPHKKS